MKLVPFTQILNFSSCFKTYPVDHFLIRRIDYNADKGPLSSIISSFVLRCAISEW